MHRRSFLAAGLGTGLFGLAGCSAGFPGVPTPEPLPPDPTLQWLRRYGKTDVGESFHTLLATADGGFLVGGSWAGGSGLLRTDRGGEERWRRFFEGVVSAVETPDGGFVTLVRWRSQGTYELVGLTVDGATRWRGTPWPSGPPDPFPYYTFTSLAPAHDGGYLLAGAYIEPTERDGQARWSPLVVAVSESGDVRWERVFTAPDVLDYVDDQGNETWRPGFEEAKGIVQAADGDGYLLLCRTTEWSPYLRRIESDGTEAWRRYYGPSYTATLETLSPAMDGAILAGTNHTTGGETSIQEPWLLAVDADGEPRWSYVYQFGDPGDRQSADFVDVVTTPDGAPVVAGTYHPDGEWGPLSRPMLAGFGRDGTRARWVRQYGDSGGSGHAVVRTDDDSFVLAGSLNEVRPSAETGDWRPTTDALLLDAGQPTESNVGPVRHVEGPIERPSEG